MSEFESPPPADPDREITDYLDAPDPEAPADALHPPQQDDDRPVPSLEDDDLLDDAALQEENAGTSLDQPSDDS